MIKLMPHGVGCCGVTHLFLGGTREPSDEVEAMAKYDPTRPTVGAQSAYMYIIDGNPPHRSRLTAGYATPAFSLDRPAESLKDRVVALVEGYKKSGRSGGVIEATTSSYQKAWEPILEALGFVCAASAVNPNSHRTIKVWLLAYGAAPGTGAHDPKEDS